MTRNAIVILLSATLAVGCKQTVVKPDPETQRELDNCRKTLAEKDKLVQAVQDENARLMRGGTGSEIVVAIEGNVLTVRPGKPGDVRPIDDKVAAAASQQFIDVVQRSKGSIQKCYEQALKKNTSLQAHAITVTIMASFTPQGAYQKASFSSSAPLDSTFESCMKTIASKWQLPPSQVSTFKTQVSLTPS